MYSSIIDNIVTEGACQYDSINHSIDSYYDAFNDINYILIPLRQEKYRIFTITNIQFSSDFESTELCFIIQEPWSGIPTSIDDYPIILGDSRDPIYLELASGGTIRFDEGCPRKITFIYVRDHYPPDCSELKDLPGIKIMRYAFTVPTDRLEDFTITIGCPIQWDSYAFGEQFIKSPIFFWGSLSDWCGGSQNFELCKDYYDLEHQEHLDTIASDIGLCLSDAWDGLIYVRDSLVQNQDPLFKELLLTEIFLTQDLIENIQKNDEKKRNGSLAFYLKREHILPEPDSESDFDYDEIKLKIIFTEESIKNETNLKEIRRLFLDDSDNDCDYFSDAYGCPLYLESDSTLVAWTQHDHNLMDLWWSLGTASPEKAPFYIYNPDDTESQITLTDILQNSSIIKIGDYAFAGMRFERDYDLDFSKSKILSIGRAAFDYCTNDIYKWYITLPKQIILKEDSLSVSGSIETVYFEGEAKEWPEFYAQQMRQALNGSSLTTWRYYRFDLYCKGNLLETFGDQEFYQNEKINLTDGTFYNVTSLKTIYLAASTPFYEHTFNSNSEGIKTIYSRLTLSQWEKLPYYIQPSNNIDIYLYSEKMPSEEDFQSGYCFWYPSSGNMVMEGFSLSSDKNKNMIDSKYFQVNHDGKIYAENAEISGTIIAKDGLIGDWVIKDGKISIEKLSDVSNNLGTIEAGIIQSPNFLKTAVPIYDNYTGTVGLSYHSMSIQDSVVWIVMGTELSDDQVNIVIPSYYSTPSYPYESYDVFALGNNAFANNTSIETVNIHDSLEGIGLKTFLNCSALSEIILPSTLTNIQTNAFLGCSALKRVFFRGSFEEWKKVKIASGNECLLNAAEKYFYNASSSQWESLGGFKISCDVKDDMIDSSFFKVSQFGEISASRVDLTGKITATEGNIAGWAVGDIYNSDSTLMGSGIYNWQENQNLSTGMAAVPGSDVMAFWAGCDKENPWQKDAKTAFYVTNEGRMVATKGKIGEFEVEPDGSLKSPFIILNPQKLYFPINAELNLNDKVLFMAEQNQNFITTKNDVAFTIQNYSGAGIQFQADKTPVTNTVKLKVIISVSEDGNIIKGFDGNKEVGYLPYTATLSMPLPFPISESITIRYAPDLTFGTVDVPFEIKMPMFETTVTGQIKLEDVGVYPKFWPTFSNNALPPTGVFFGDTFKAQGEDEKVVHSYSSKNNSLWSLGNFSPQEDKLYSLGENGKAWGNLHLYVGTEYGSDRNLKNTIESLHSNFDIFFDNLKPVSYILNNGNSGRKHIGFIAQDVEEGLALANIDTKDFAGICIPSLHDSHYTLRYIEFIGLCVDQIQKLKKRVAELENKNKES
jgi:hypothetical protein